MALPLDRADEAEVLSFLGERAIHTVSMAGLIRDNGLVSEHNRGTFYGCRDEMGRLEGVALIGHATLFDARTPRAVAAFARQAQEVTRAHMIMGERGAVSEFWLHYAGSGQPARLVCREHLFELSPRLAVVGEVGGLRRATARDLELIVPVQAQMAYEESGVNPLDVDPEGFRRRCARRIEMGRTWVLIDSGELVFKAEVFADTPEACYLEGVYTAPERRGTGIGARCLSQLAAALFRSTRSVCVLVNEQNREAQAFYRRVGFRFKCVYDTIFLQR